MNHARPRLEQLMERPADSFEDRWADPPADSNIGKAARLVAGVFGCPAEEAAKVLTVGINARIAEQVAAEQSGQIQDS